MQGVNGKFRPIIFVFIVVLLCLGSSEAEITELREIDGKLFACTISGLTSDLKDCGEQSDWYTYVFVGSISAVGSADKKNERELQITPEEIFHGSPPTPLIVRTSQGACFPPFTVGDRWLFFFRKEGVNPITLDYYGNISSPIADAQGKIETLRRLKEIGDFGILRGQVKRGEGEEAGVKDARVKATRESDHAQFFATTDANGRFEFQPLAPGKYDLAVDPIDSFRPDDSVAQISRGSCWDVTMIRYPHAQIAGHLKHSDGSPVANASVFIMDEDGYNTEESDAEGYFHSDDMRPGKYVIGINLPSTPAWKYASCGGAACELPPIYLYYPGVADRSNAEVINLGKDEKRNDIDFTIPTQ